MRKTLFFILGSGRMGSTLLYRLLREHPQVALTNEARVFDALYLAYHAVVTPYGERSHLGFEGVLRPDLAESFVPLCLANAKQTLEAFYDGRFGKSYSHFGDKLPSVAAAYEMSKLWEDARHLVLLRDPRDVVCSYRSLQGVPDPTRLGPNWQAFLDRSIEDFATVWANTYREILALIPSFLLIRYEAFVQAPAPTMARVLDHLELDSVPELTRAMADLQSQAGHGTTSTPEQSLQRWKKELSPAESELVMALCGEIFERLKELPGGADA